MTYEPTFVDIAWTKNLIQLIKEGGHWGIPMNGSVYQVSHTSKTFTLVVGVPDELHEQLGAVLDQLGWRLETASTNPE